MTKLIIPQNIVKGAIIPTGLISLEGLSGTAKLLWVVLSDYAGKDGKCYPSYETLAQVLGIKRRQVIRLMNQLVEQKLILIEKRYDDSNNYYFLNHPCLYRGGDIQGTNGCHSGQAGVSSEARRGGQNVTQTNLLTNLVTNLGSPDCVGTAEQPFIISNDLLTGGKVAKFEPDKFKVAETLKKKNLSKKHPDFIVHYNIILTEYGYTPDNFISIKIKSMVKTLLKALGENKIDPYIWVEDVVKNWKLLRKETAWKDSGKERLREIPSLEEIAITRVALVESLLSLKQKKNTKKFWTEKRI